MTDDAIMSPVHPGEVLQEEYLDPLGLTQHRVAVAINVPPRRINEIEKDRLSAALDRIEPTVPSDDAKEQHLAQAGRTSP